MAVEYLYVRDQYFFIFFYQQKYWASFSKTRLDRVLANVQTNQWTYQVLENALKLVAPKFLKDYNDAMQLVGSCFRFPQWRLGFGNLPIITPRSPYLRRLLPFNYMALDGRGHSNPSFSSEDKTSLKQIPPIFSSKDLFSIIDWHVSRIKIVSRSSSTVYCNGILEKRTRSIFRFLKNVPQTLPLRWHSLICSPQNILELYG